VESVYDQASGPTSFAIFVGRAAESARLAEMTAQVPVTIVVGVPGVGKSALVHAHAARWRGRVMRQRVTDAPFAALLDDARRALAGDVVEELGSDAERVADLAHRLAAVSGLWVLDDFHRLGDAAQSLLIGRFTAAAGGARLVATSRQAPLPRAQLADHAQLRLEPLDEAGGRALWQALDDLYGPSQRFDVAWRRSHGLPLLLRQAHAGGFDQEDPIDGALRALSEDERWLAGALALSEVPLSGEALLAFRPVARPALRRLISRFVVDIDGAGICTLHDLFADGMRAALSPDERRSLHAVIAQALLRLDLDPSIQARNVCAHLIAAGQEDQAADWLVHRSRELLRRGASAELLRAIDAIAPDHRPRSLRIERGRALLRVLDAGRALAELRQAAASADPGSDPIEFDEIKVSLAQAALLAGEATLARDTVAPLLARPALGLHRTTRAAAVFVAACSYLGAGDEARAVLEDLANRLDDVDEATLLGAFRVFTLWSEERDDAAGRAIGAIPSPPAHEATSHRAAIIPAILGLIMARQGRIEEAERALQRCCDVESRRADPLFQLQLGYAHASVLYESGERLGALERLLSTYETCARSGCVLGRLVTGAWVVRALLLLGRRGEALERLALIEDEARARGLAGILAAVERTRRLDPMRQLAEPPLLPAPGRRNLLVRARSLLAVQAAAAGDPERARELLCGMDAIVATPGYALDRALAHVADAARARLAGSELAVEQALARATAEALPGAPDAFDPELPRALLDLLGRLRVIGGRGRRLAVSDDAQVAGAPVVIDARRHEIRAGGSVVSLSGRPIVRRLLYAIAESPGRALGKEALARAAWGREYSPLVHDNPLKSNMGHLRRLLCDTGVVVVADELGYRLELPPGALFVDLV
jgi:tetratricopeptide (TPR) repeat protein